MNLISTLNASFPDYDFRYGSTQYCSKCSVFYGLCVLPNVCTYSRAPNLSHTTSTIKADDFARCSIKDMCATVQSALSDVSEQQGSEFTTTLWAAIDEVITLKECEVFAYIPDNDDDPFSSNSLYGAGALALHSPPAHLTSPHLTSPHVLPPRP